MSLYDSNYRAPANKCTDRCTPEERAKAKAIQKKIKDKPIRRIKNTEELRAMGYGKTIYAAHVQRER